MKGSAGPPAGSFADPSAEPSAVLRDGLRRLAVPNPDRVQPLLEKFLDELQRWNPRFGLVNCTDRREIVVKHVLDSLSGLSTVRDALGSGGTESASGGAVLDVGSGAGFPGIPLAAAMPDVPVTLLERMARRASFLRTCAVLLGLPHLRVVHSDLSGARGDFDVVTFRAVAPFGRFLEEIGKSAVEWRTVVAYKGRKDRAQREIDDVRRSAQTADEADDMRIVRLEPPFLSEERCLLVARRKELLTKP